VYLRGLEATIKPGGRMALTLKKEAENWILE
jgi:hypothetical protein